MSAVPVASYLVDFASEPGGAMPVRPERRPERESTIVQAEQARRAAAELEAAFQRGMEAGRAEAEAAAEARFAMRLEQLEAQRVGEREARVRDEAAKIAESFVAGLKGIEANIANAAARTLAPVLFDKVRRQAVTELSALLNDVVSRQHGLSIEVSGPKDLLDELTRSLAGHRIHITTYPSSDCDVRVQCGQTVIETRLATLAERIGEALR